MANSSALTTRFAADITQFEREIKKMSALSQKMADQLARDAQKSANKMASIWSGGGASKAFGKEMASIASQISRLAPALAAMFGTKEVIGAADSWKRFGNQLKVAGVEGAATAVVQQQLYDIAIKNGTALEPLGTLYGKVAAAQKALGVTQPQILKITEAVSMALKIQGTTAEEASGGLLQLSQMMASGKVQAEEFNSVNESMRPLLVAAAGASDKFKGSVAAMKAAVVDGKLSSAEFAQLVLKGMDSLRESAAKADLTVGQAMTNLQSAFQKFIGTTDETYNVSNRLVGAINLLAANFGTVAESVAVVGAVYAATFIPALIRSAAGIAATTAATVSSTVASVAETGALITRTAAIYGVSTASATAAVSMRALSGAMAFLGGPWGIAIMGIVAALGYLSYSSIEAAASTEQLNNAQERLTAERIASEKAAYQARVATGNLSGAEEAALVKTANLTGQVALLSTEYGRLAVEAKKAALAIADKRLAEANATAAGRKAEGVKYVLNRTDQLSRPVFVERGMSLPGTPRGIAEKQAVNEWLATDQGKRWLEDRRNVRGAQRERDRIAREDATVYAPPKPEVISTGGGKPKKTRTPKPYDPTTRSDSTLADAEKAYADAMRESADTIEEREKYTLEDIETDRKANVQKVANALREKKITAAAAGEATAKYNEVAAIRSATARRKAEEEIQDRNNAFARAGLDLQVETLNNQAEELKLLASHADLLSDKQKYERQALEKQQEADRMKFKSDQDQLEIDRRRQGMTEELIRSLRAQAEANFRQAQTTAQNGQNQDQAKERQDKMGKPVKDQIKDMASGFGTLNQQLGAIATGGIASLTSGLTEAIMGTKNLKEAFTDMAKSIISQLIEMAVRFVIFEAIGMALGVPGLGKAAIGLGPVKANAMGTNNFSGGLSVVGEKGPELAYLPGGTQIAPNNLLRAALSNTATSKGQNGSSTIVNMTVNAQDAVLTDTVKGWVREGVVQSIQAAQRVIPQNMNKKSYNTLYRG